MYRQCIVRFDYQDLEFIHTCWINFIRKRLTSFQNQTSQLKIKSIQDIIKKISAGVERSNCPKHQHLYLWLQRTKKQIWQLLKFVSLFLHFRLLVEKSNRGPDILPILPAFLLKLKNQFGITFMSHSSNYLANISI